MCFNFRKKYVEVNMETKGTQSVEDETGVEVKNLPREVVQDDPGPDVSTEKKHLKTKRPSEGREGKIRGIGTGSV